MYRHRKEKDGSPNARGMKNQKYDVRLLLEKKSLMREGMSCFGEAEKFGVSHGE